MKASEVLDRLGSSIAKRGDFEMVCPDFEVSHLVLLEDVEPELVDEKVMEVTASPQSVKIGTEVLNVHRRLITFCGRKVFIECLNNGEDEGAMICFGDELGRLCDERANIFMSIV